MDKLRKPIYFALDSFGTPVSQALKDFWEEETPGKGGVFDSAHRFKENVSFHLSKSGVRLKSLGWLVKTIDRSQISDPFFWDQQFGEAWVEELLDLLGVPRWEGCTLFERLDKAPSGKEKWTHGISGVSGYG